jgi:uncharacterized protein YprB with RNaseH-like and TPR domain
MRDLASRLRAIVKSDPTKNGRTHPRGGFSDPAEAPVRELRYEPDLPESSGTAGPACVQSDHLLDSYRSHGRRPVGDYALDAALPLALFDARSAEMAPDWASRVVFWDTETTGLSGGAGTLAFLVGCGWFEADGFHIRQFLLTSAAGEADMLDAVGEILGNASLLVTYNGRTFDAPLMDMRWAFHRKANPIESRPHFDMLPVARRLWGGREAPSSCSLSAIERSVLGFHRHDDVPGFEIPSRYFHFLRSGDASILDGVLEHNRHDLISLAAVTSHALRLAQEGPQACRDNHEQLALGRVYERAGQASRAHEAYTCAATAGAAESIDARRQAFARLAVLARRDGRFDESAAAWRSLLDLAGPGRRRAPNALERQAIEALAIHHEHRAHDLAAAKRYAETMRDAVAGETFNPTASRIAAETAHRLARLNRKIEVAADHLAGPEPARLLPDS